MSNSTPQWIAGVVDGRRLDSRLLEEAIQKALSGGARYLKIEAHGQHGLGGRLWSAGREPVHVKIYGSPGQRVGSMGFPNTLIEVMGPASDDVGWLNAGAEIVVHGHATNGVANAMAQGKVMIAGSIGSRGMTMTKHNPRFEPPQLWVLGSVGDYFAEFMAGGVAVVCGHEPQDVASVLGYRPCVGMVGGRIFFRGPQESYSRADAKLAPIGDDDWAWLQENLNAFLDRIHRSALRGELGDRAAWRLLVARGPKEKQAQPRRSMAAFRREVWDAELGQGGLIGDICSLDRSPVEVITSGDLRRFVPVWENRAFASPCEAACPTGIPVQDRWRLVREGRFDEAMDLALAYTPFPASVCGYLCPHLCMESCSRAEARLESVDVAALGQASLDARLPELPPLGGGRVAVIGGGPAGVSAAWQLRLKGHEAVVHDLEDRLGGKMNSVIPASRLPQEVLGREIDRIAQVLPQVRMKKALTLDDFNRLKSEFDFLVVATGARKPRLLDVPGGERAIPALDFLRQSKAGQAKAGRRVVIVGAGNVGCDCAAEAHRLGARDITLIDIQQPASFGKEREAAESVGAKFRWPAFTKAITAKGVELKTGELLPADTVIVSIGDQPELDFLPPEISRDRGFIRVDADQRTSDPRVFAIGDAVKPGLLTDAIGAGRRAASAIDRVIRQGQEAGPSRPTIPAGRVKLEYLDPRLEFGGDLKACSAQCASCGACRDCGICVAICPQGAISRRELAAAQGRPAGFEMVVDGGKCIGCGFCAGACPCGVWNLKANFPLE